jgi:hypothetical protein
MGPISIPDVRVKHQRFEHALESLVDRVSTQSGNLARRHVYQTPHFKPRTGNLQRSTDFQVVRLKSGRRIKIYNTAPYAAAIDRGARPHIIRARKARALHFNWPGFWSVSTKSPEWFLRSVHHPGNKPYRFLWHATWGAYRFAGGRLRHGMTLLARKF